MSVTTLSTGIGQLGPAALGTARDALNGDGALILRGSVDVAVLAAARAALTDQLAPFDPATLGRRGVRVGDGRYMISIPLEPPFDRPQLFASAIRLLLAGLAQVVRH